MKRWLNRLLQLLSLVIFVLILWWAGPETWRQLLDSEWQPLLAALLVYGAAGAVAATRLRVISYGINGEHVGSWRRFYYLAMMARALGIVLPRGLSSLGGKAVGLRALGLSLRRSLWTVVVDNAYDVVSLALVTPVAILFLQGRIGAALFGLSLLALWLLLGLLIGWATASGWLRTLLQWLSRRFPWLRQRLRLDAALADDLLPTPRSAVAALAWTVALNLLLITTYKLISDAVNLDLSWWLFAASFPIAQLSLIIAVAPGGLGIFDLGWLGLLRLGGVSQADALTFVVAQRAFIMVFVLIWAAVGVLLSMTEGGGEPLPRPSQLVGRGKDDELPDSAQ